ncbi:MAG: hypothetical protein JNL72_09600 [Flavipsychrobacter sp.]|nr:hypothetical protein [Flavipsychrobacter sp.]
MKIFGDTVEWRVDGMKYVSTFAKTSIMQSPKEELEYAKLIVEAGSQYEEYLAIVETANLAALNETEFEEVAFDYPVQIVVE